MKVKFFKCIIFGIYLFLANAAFAHSHETCSMSNKNSCWFAENSSSYTSKIYCQDSYKSTFKTTLSNLQTYSYQFCSGWGDGLGYPEPGITSRCLVELSNGKKVNFHITSIEWGNTVDIKVNDSEITVTQKDFRSNHRELKNTYSF